MYYDGNQTLTYNALFNFIVGNRGAGKTYWSKHWAIRDFIKTGAQFVYVRRYKQELKKNKLFFADILHEFPEHKLEVKGMEYYIDGQLAGVALPLSTSKIEKSTPFPRVNKIIFDEFIIDRGTYHYLADEVVNFLELYETVARMRDVRVFFLSNAITQTNPYFLYFKIRLPKNNQKVYRTGDILLQLVGNEEFIQAKKKTRFGQLIQGTSYGDYAIDNQFLRDDESFISKKAGTARHSFTFVYKGQSFGVWTDYTEGRIWVSMDVDPSCPYKYALTLDEHRPNTMLIKRLSAVPVFKSFIDNYKLGNVYFENMTCKNVAYEAIRLILI